MGSWRAGLRASRHMLNTGRFIWRAEQASKKAEDERAVDVSVRKHEERRLQNLYDREMAVRAS